MSANSSTMFDTVGELPTPRTSSTMFDVRGDISAPQTSSTMFDEIGTQIATDSFASRGVNDDTIFNFSPGTPDFTIQVIS